jgi:hypothetical protein
MTGQIRFAKSILILLIVCFAGTLLGQQKPQWLPGQVGLNAGILPSPGFTYVNVAVRYDVSRFNGPSGNAILNGSLITNKNYNVWADENLFYYVLPGKVLGGNLGAMVGITPVSGFLTADILPNLTDLTASGGGSGLTDLWFQPLNLGWHAKRVDIQVGDGMVFPTGRYTPGASDNVGSGYYGNHVQTGTTLYVTKNKGTSANLFTDWEVHSQRPGTNGTEKTPGQAFTMEWGLGQVLPLKKNMTQLLQLGVVGYDQWQVTNNSGTVPIGGTGLTADASLIPFYSVHAVGGQASYILPTKNLVGFFKYYDEYLAYSHFQGTTIVFGLTWSVLEPKPTAHQP